MFDIDFLVQKKCKLNLELFNKLYEYWKVIHGEPRKSNLNLSKDEFFNNALKEYDHDYLHTLINPSPIYKMVLKDGSEVEPDEIKFNNLTFDEKVDLVQEEVYVMAYERLYNRTWREAYHWMLKKFIIHHAPIYEALFIIQNYRLIQRPKINYKEKLDYELSRNN